MEINTLNEIDILAEELSFAPKTKLCFKTTCHNLDYIKHLLKKNNMSIEELDYNFILKNLKENPIF